MNSVNLLLQAGVAVTDITLSLSLVQDYEELGRVLARSPPLWEPGTAHGYHAMTWGLYASQLLTRADPKKRTMGQFFRDEVAEPFGKLNCVCTIFLIKHGTQQNYDLSYRNAALKYS